MPPWHFLGALPPTDELITGASRKVQPGDTWNQLRSKKQGWNKTIPALEKPWDLDLIWGWDFSQSSMLKACRCSWMFGQMFDFHKPGYSLLRNWDCIPVQWDSFSYKTLSSLTFHAENLMLLCISKPYFLLPSRESPRWAPEGWLGSSHTPCLHQEFTQKRPICPKSRWWLSQCPWCPRCIMQAIPIHQTVLQT